MENVKIEHGRPWMDKMDKLGEDAIQSEKVLDIIINGPTAMSISKETLRGVIRVLLTGAAAEVTAAENALKDACEYLGENGECPEAAIGGTGWPECDGENGACGDIGTVADCWKWYFTEKAKAEEHG